MKLAFVLLSSSLLACSASDGGSTGPSAASYCSKKTKCTNAGATQKDVDACVAFEGGDRGEAQAYGCTTQYDTWFACADADFVCSDGFPTTKDCGEKKNVLQACIDAVKKKGGTCVDRGGATDAERYCSRENACLCASDESFHACLADQQAQAGAARAYGCEAEWNTYLSCFVGASVCQSGDFGVPTGSCDTVHAQLQSCFGKS
jgi:hypothetical protein